MTASKRARDGEAGRHAHEVASFEAELVAEVTTPPTRMASAGLVLACGGQPRRLVLVLLFMLIAVAALMISRQERIARFVRVRTCADRFRQRLNFTDFVKDMKQDEFARYYRLPSRAAFDDVLSRVSPPAKQVAFRAHGRHDNNRLSGAPGLSLAALAAPSRFHTRYVLYFLLSKL